MNDYVITEPSPVYAFDFPEGYNATQSDLTQLAGAPGGSFEAVEEPDGSSTVAEIRQPIGQHISGADCALMCASRVLGVEDIITAAGVASTPFPKSWAGLPQGMGGATRYTNLPSVIAHNNPRIGNARIPIRVPTPVITSGGGIAMRRTANVVRIFGRWIPGIGWGLLALDVINFTRCYTNCMAPPGENGSASFFQDLRETWAEGNAAISRGWDPFRR